MLKCEIIEEGMTERITSFVYMIRDVLPLISVTKGERQKEKVDSPLKRNSILIPLLLLMICLVSTEMSEAG